MKLLVTGASGYIGQRLVTLAAAQGHTIVCATRRACPGPHEWLPYDLRGQAPACPPDVQVIIHLAADTSGSGSLGPNEEMAAAHELIRCAEQVGSRFIFISSQTANPQASTTYGRTKWRIEQEVLNAAGVVVRPGQVYGGAEQGLFGTLCNLVRRVPVIPVLLPAPAVQPIHVDDLASAILTIVERPQLPAQVFCLGAAAPVSFDRFLFSISTHRVHALRLPVPLPVGLLKFMSTVLGRSRSVRLGLERIFSLTTLPPMDSAPSLRLLDVKLRPLAEGMHRSGQARRRLLLQEGAILLGYLLKATPSSSLTRRYVRALEQAGQPDSIIIPTLLTRWPVLLTLLDNPHTLGAPHGQALARRLQVALSIAEASPQGAVVFLGDLKAHGPFATLIAMGIAVLKELFWRVSAMACRPFIRPLFIGSERKREA